MSRNSKFNRANLLTSILLYSENMRSMLASPWPSAPSYTTRMTPTFYCKPLTDSGADTPFSASVSTYHFSQFFRYSWMYPFDSETAWMFLQLLYNYRLNRIGFILLDQINKYLMFVAHYASQISGGKNMEFSNKICQFTTNIQPRWWVQTSFWHTVQCKIILLTSGGVE